MNRQGEALRVAKELLTDVELKRLNASEIVMKANRLARLVGHEGLLTFLVMEREGYPSDGSANEWIGRAGRWAQGEKNKGMYYGIPLTQVESLLEGDLKAVDALKGGGNYSGEYATIASGEHDKKIMSLARSIGTRSSICAAVVSTVYGMVVEIYHELLFSELQATLFADTQSRVDGALAATGGSALDKIERVSDC